ncbi:MAG: glutaredoxin family protein [Bacilli bacterium]
MEKGVEFDYVDITKSDKNRAVFEKFRNSRSEYKNIIADGKKFGIPVLFYKNQLVIGFNKAKIDDLIQL